MNTVAEEIRINAPKSQVWDIINDLAGIQNFSPDVRKSYYSTDLKEGLDAARICEFHNDITVAEKVIDWENGKSLTLSVDFTSGMKPPVKNITGQLSLREDGSHTIVTMQLTYDTKLGVIGKAMNQVMIKSQYKKTIQRILDGLKYHAETGQVVDTKIPSQAQTTAA
jgi:carbon monoxide dehydrogenase subunit G